MRDEPDRLKRSGLTSKGESDVTRRIAVIFVALKDDRVVVRGRCGPGVRRTKPERQIDDYAATAGARISQLRGYSGKQPGDPVRDRQRGRVPESATPSSSWQRCLRLGMAKLDVLRKEFSAWEAVSRGADFLKETYILTGAPLRFRSVQID